jgi:hypothetical protein
MTARSFGAPAWLALLALLAAVPVRAAEFERLAVTEDAGTYRIEALLSVNAPPEAVVRALLDFEAQREIAPPIREIKIIGTVPDGGWLVHIVTEICIGPFCRSVKQVQVVRFQPPNRVNSEAVPDRGDVRSAHTAVEVSGKDGQARIQLECTVRPSRRRPFFVPKGWVLNALRSQARESATGLEALAARLASQMPPSRPAE